MNLEELILLNFVYIFHYLLLLDNIYWIFIVCDYEVEWRLKNDSMEFGVQFSFSRLNFCCLECG